MSVATEFAPVVDLPAHALLRDDPAPVTRLATVTTLLRPSERSVAPSLHLTRRGAVVLGAAVAVLAGVLIGAAWLSAPGSGAALPSSAPTSVTVRAGDSLWSIAERVAPNRDPRAEVAMLQQVNHLADSTLMAGQVLRTR